MVASSRPVSAKPAERPRLGARGLGTRRLSAHSLCAHLSTVAAVSLTTACAGGVPLLQPAHVLPSGKLAAGAGLSGHFAAGKLDERITAGADDDGTAAEQDKRRVEAGIAEATVEEGVAPWLSMRVGLGHHTEAGLTYSGRSARADGRYALESEEFALSAGAGVSARLKQLRDESLQPSQGQTVQTGTFGDAVPGVDTTAVGGFGADIPITFGYRAAGGIAQTWLTLRAGYERLSGNLLIQRSATGARQEAPLNAALLNLGAAFGLQVGIETLSVALEVAADWRVIDGDVDIAAGGQNTLSLRTSGLVLTPAAALRTTF